MEGTTEELRDVTEPTSFLLQSKRQVVRKRIDERTDVVLALVARDGDADARLFERDGREAHDIGKEAHLHQAMHQIVCDAGPAGGNETDRCHRG